jgi:glucose/arabinose dehydrogenase
MTFHDDYENNGFFYLNYTDLAGDTRIVRYSVSASPDKADPNSEELILFVDQPFSNHNTGWLDFGPDGYLYVPLGDGGSACDPGQRAQDITDQLLGKMMRLDVDGPDAFPADPNKNYAIPPDNPFVGISGDDEIWAYGLRNPWRDSFDRGTGDLYIADVGQNLREEVNYQMAGDAGGRNYGWDCEEGLICANLSPQCNGSVNGCACGAAGLVDPVHNYDHGSGRCSISGGYVYRGCDIPEEEGNYFFADFCSGQIWSMPAGGGAVTERTALFPAGVATITSFGEDLDGELYIADQGSTFPPVTVGEIWKITRSPPLTDADIDRDGDKDIDDADLLADVLLGIGIFDACTLKRADVNGDGDRDGLDIQEWIDTP